MRALMGAPLKRRQPLKTAAALFLCIFFSVQESSRLAGLTVIHVGDDDAKCFIRRMDDLAIADVEGNMSDLTRTDIRIEYQISCLHISQPDLTPCNRL